VSQLCVATALQQAQAELHTTENPRLEASLLLCHLLSWSQTKLISHDDEVLTEAQSKAFDALVARRLAGEPSAYIVGTRGFWSFDLEVTPDTLIPRPDTEALVEHSLHLLADTQAPRILDLGTGSGAVALALATELPQAKVEASDFSAAALAVAKRNALNLGITLDAWHLGSWFEPLAADSRYDLIVSNPPYIADNDPHLDALEHEPISALTSGADGLHDIRLLVEQSPAYLNNSGHLAIEHGFDQAHDIAQLFLQAGYTELQQIRDLGGNIRVSAARAPSHEQNT